MVGRENSRNPWPGNRWPATSSGIVRVIYLSSSTVPCRVRLVSHSRNQPNTATMLPQSGLISHSIRTNERQILYNIRLYFNGSRSPIIFVVYIFRIAFNILLCGVGRGAGGWHVYRLFRLLSHAHMSLLIYASPSLHCLGSTVCISRRPRHRMVKTILLHIRG